MALYALMMIFIFPLLLTKNFLNSCESVSLKIPSPHPFSPRVTRVHPSSPTFWDYCSFPWVVSLPLFLFLFHAHCIYTRVQCIISKMWFYPFLNKTQECTTAFRWQTSSLGACLHVWFNLQALHYSHRILVKLTWIIWPLMCLLSTHDFLKLHIFYLLDQK